MDRRRFLALGAAIGTGGLAGCTFRQSAESAVGDGPEIGLEPVVRGLTFPTAMAFLPNGDRLVGERFGMVLRHTDGGLVEEPFLDVREQLSGTDNEKGLLGLALHPEFEDNRKLYVRYSGRSREWMDESYSHTAVLSEFEATPDLTGVVPDSERHVLEVPEPGPLHNAGGLAFGPDGYLYVALGDGQRTNLGEQDQSWWYDQGLAAQNVEDNLLGGILRLDVDARTDDRGYGIPPDNPLVGEPGRDEYYAWGLRNPYRISFDGDDLFVGNVGEHIRESVYLVERGDNCGWPTLEGSSCSGSTSIGHALEEDPLNAFNPKTWLAQTNRISPVKVCPTSDSAGGAFTRPIAEYHRAGSRAVTGGYVYRGDDVPSLRGQYLFGDFSRPAPLFALDDPGEGERPQEFTELVVAGSDDGRLDEALLSFARDPDGELYVLSTEFAEGTGHVRRLTTPG